MFLLGYSCRSVLTLIPLPSFRSLVYRPIKVFSPSSHVTWNSFWWYVYKGSFQATGLWWLLCWLNVDDDWTASAGMQWQNNNFWSDRASIKKRCLVTVYAASILVFCVPIINHICIQKGFEKLATIWYLQMKKKQIWMYSDVVA